MLVRVFCLPEHEGARNGHALAHQGDERAAKDGVRKVERRTLERRRLELLFQPSFGLA